MEKQKSQYVVVDKLGNYGSKYGYKVVARGSKDLAYLFDTIDEAQGFALYCSTELKRDFKVVKY